MIYQKINLRSPLSIIRNQLKQNNSMSRSISPDYSPITRKSKNLSFNLPVRSNFKSENAKPSLSTSKHLELQSKRKKLMQETKLLEEKIKEIKKKVQIEVNVSRMKTGNGKRIEKIFLSLDKSRKKSIFDTFKEINKGLKRKQEERISQWKKKSLKKVFFCLKKMTWGRILKTREKVEMSNRHFRLQLLLKSFCCWQDQVTLKRKDSNSYLEEMDSLIDSFIQDSLIVN